MALTGKVRWRFDPHIRINGPWRNSYEGRKNRGVAVWNGRVYVGTGDCRVVAIDAATGGKVWDTRVCDADQTGITDAPRVGDGKVFTGWAGMEYDVRGGVVALDAQTGKRAWTFWTAPGDPSKPYESKTLQAGRQNLERRFVEARWCQRLDRDDLRSGHESVVHLDLDRRRGSG